ncbi:hypothetical protein FF38_02264 [Lucilia cuprina]|uniref:Uncharacterized protein n=1 Tax=Lucilia cuprina TaxID=7375 RepID=A0A0L0CIK0_LUCCU|nr:hypothetical protein FF38_02264 [Lucilia cuprina]
MTRTAVDNDDRVVLKWRYYTPKDSINLVVLGIETGRHWTLTSPRTTSTTSILLTFKTLASQSKFSRNCLELSCRQWVPFCRYDYVHKFSDIVLFLESRLTLSATAKQNDLNRVVAAATVVVAPLHLFYSFVTRCPSALRRVNKLSNTANLPASDIRVSLSGIIMEDHPKRGAANLKVLFNILFVFTANNAMFDGFLNIVGFVISIGVNGALGGSLIKGFSKVGSNNCIFVGL